VLDCSFFHLLPKLINLQSLKIGNVISDQLLTLEKCLLGAVYFKLQILELHTVSLFVVINIIQKN
jgi:hypothetical protein